MSPSKRNNGLRQKSTEKGRNDDIFNLWSVINYFGDDCKARPFGENTGNNAIVGEVLEEADAEIMTLVDTEGVPS